MSSVVRHLPRPAAGRSAAVVGDASGSADLVGRVEELSRLADLLDDVVVDGSRLVLVGGDAGSGKTTVIDAFVQRLDCALADRHAQVIRGQCVPMGGDGLPYAPIVGALRDLISTPA